MSPGTNTTLQQGQKCCTSYFPKGKHCLCVCGSLSAGFYCTLKAICAVFFHTVYTITLLQEGTEQLPWRSIRPTNSVPLPMEKKGNFSKDPSRQKGLLAWHPAQGRQGFSLMQQQLARQATQRRRGHPSLEPGKEKGARQSL